MAAAHADHWQRPFRRRGPRVGLERIAVLLDPAGREATSPVAAGIDVRAAGEQEPVHRGEGLRPGRRRQTGVNDDHVRSVPGDGIDGIGVGALPRPRAAAAQSTVDRVSFDPSFPGLATTSA